MALANTKSTSSNVADDASTLGTAVNPRERPRGIAAPPSMLINFNQPTQRPTVIPPPAPPSTSSPATTPSRPSHQRSGSAAQLMFDDDFSQFPTHALSLTNIPNTTTISTPTSQTTATPERNVSRARPSPPSSISTATGLVIQQQLFPPPPIASNNTQSNTGYHQHRRSASQTISPANNQLSFPSNSSNTEISSSNERRHSIDSSVKQNQGDVLFMSEAFDDDDDADALASNLTKLKVYNHSTENVKSRESLILNEDDRLFAKTYTINSQLKSDDEQTSSSSSSPSSDDNKTPEKNHRVCSNSTSISRISFFFRKARKNLNQH